MKYQEFYDLYLSAAESPDFETFVTEEGLPPAFADYPDDKIMPIFEAVWGLRDNPIKGIKEACGITNQYISDKYRIPLRSVNNWSADIRTPPTYTTAMLAYCVFKDEEII